jgi:hypothetical protein
MHEVIDGGAVLRIVEPCPKSAKDSGFPAAELECSPTTKVSSIACVHVLSNVGLHLCTFGTPPHKPVLHINIVFAHMRLDVRSQLCLLKAITVSN